LHGRFGRAARSRLGAQPVALGDVPPCDPAAGVPADDPAARQLHQLAPEGDLARLGDLGRGAHAPQRHADAGAFPDPRSLRGGHGLLPDPHLGLGCDSTPAGEAFWPVECREVQADRGDGTGCADKRGGPGMSEISMNTASGVEGATAQSQLRDVPAVRMEAVYKHYGDFTALDQVDLKVAKGEKI